MSDMDANFSWEEYYALHNGTSRYGDRKTLTQADIIAAQSAADPIAPEPVKSSKTCPKCGKSLGKGAHFHIKSCSGANVPD